MTTEDRETRQMHDEQGNLRGEMQYHNGLADGQCRLWYPGGQLHQESSFTSGVLNGAFRTWWENGNLKEDSMFAWGVKTSSRHYDENGNMVSEFSG